MVQARAREMVHVQAEQMDQVIWLQSGSIGLKGQSCPFSSFFSVSAIQPSADRYNKTYELHTDQEVILVLDEEFQDLLRQHMFLGSHGVVRVGEHTRLEDKSEVCCQSNHPIKDV